MRKICTIKKTIFLSFSFAAFNCFAVDLKTAEFILGNAQRLANSSKYIEAANEMMFLLNDNSEGVRGIAESFLFRNKMVANYKIFSFQDDEVFKIACDIGNMDIAKSTIINQIEKIGKFADPIDVKSAENRVFEFFGDDENKRKISQCESEKLTLLKVEEDRRKELALDAEKKVASVLKEMNLLKFCYEYGKAIRGEKGNSDFNLVKDLQKYFDNEAKRRKLKINKNLVKEEKVKMGMSTCNLFASWGLPQSKNDTVGSWGVHTQFVYGDFGPYVYTENGSVTSWQQKY